MKKTKFTALRKLFSALALVLAVTVFTGSNSVAYAAAKQMATAANTAQGEFKPPKLTVVQDDVNGEDLYKPQKGAMSKEKAAQAGAKYLWEIFGESIDGKAVRMVYLVGQPAYTKDLWIGNVFNTASEAAIPYFSSEKNNDPLLSFRIDAKTGEWVGIGRRQPAQQRGKVLKTVTLEEMVAMMEQPPAGLDEYIKVAKAFAQQHFNKTKVVDAEYDFQEFQTDTKTGLGEGDTRDIFEKGGFVIIAVTDDTGRVAEVRVDKDTKQAYLLDTSKSDKT